MPRNHVIDRWRIFFYLLLVVTCIMIQISNGKLFVAVFILLFIYFTSIMTRRLPVVNSTTLIIISIHKRTTRQQTSYVNISHKYSWKRRSSRMMHKHMSTPCPKKTNQICFCQNFVKFPQISIIFGRKMGNDPNICEVYSFSTSPNLRHRLTVLNANVPNCYITPNVVICNKLLTT